ncbi:MAG: hypothetical protein AB1428_02235 [Bacteroidota bacterium]
MHPLSVQIVTRDSRSQREVRHQYTIETHFPRWELLKILLHAIFTVKFS